MKHVEEAALIEYHYGEAAAATEISRHLRECPVCAQSYMELERDLAAIAMQEPPQHDEAYGAEVWNAIRGALRAYPQRQSGGLRSFFGAQWKSFAVAAACAVVIATAFFAGRIWEHRGKSGDVAADGAGRQRVILLVMGDHLERSERLLVELRHAGPESEAPLQEEARDLLAENRLYRESLRQGEDPTLAGALDHLERVLIEVSNQPAGLTQARLDALQQEMNTDGLLFEVRVLRSRVRGDAQQDADRKAGASAQRKGVSI